MKTNTYEELKRLAVNLGFAPKKEDVPGEDTADVLAFINDGFEKKNNDNNSNQEETNPTDDLE